MMTLKSKCLKLIIAVVVIMLCLVAFNINDVYAKEYTNEDLQQMLNLIPNEISVDAKEIEKETASQLLKEEISNVLKNNDIDISNINLDVYIGGYTVQDKEIAKIYLKYDSLRQNKTIKIIYNNVLDYNIKDEQKAKNLSLVSPRYYEVDVDMIPTEDGTNNWEHQYKIFLNKIENYYTKQINDNCVIIKAISGAGGTDGTINYWTFEGGTYIEIYINDVLYDVRKMGQEFTVPVINIPSNVSDEELKNYVISTIKKYNEPFANDIADIADGANVVCKNSTPYEINIQDGYTITNKLREFPSYIIIRKEKSAVIPVSNTDIATNIKLDTTSDVVPEGTKIVAEKITNGDNYNTVVEALINEVSKFEMFDISLINNNAKIQPNGKVKVSIPVPAGYDTSKIVVYYVADDGTKTKIDATIENGYIVFETDHFSNYIVAEEKTATPESTTNTERTLDKTPKTGEKSMSIGLAILSIVSTIILVIFKKF